MQYLYDVSRKTVVTYDDTYSLTDKATFAKNSGLAGAFTWSLDQASRSRSHLSTVCSSLLTRITTMPYRTPSGRAWAFDRGF